jgi:hypothetical protein
VFSAALLDALRNLARKRAGEPVGWINIGGARELTELGYATRSRGGWQITASGIEALASAPLPVVRHGECSVVQFHSH